MPACCTTRDDAPGGPTESPFQASGEQNSLARLFRMMHSNLRAEMERTGQEHRCTFVTSTSQFKSLTCLSVTAAGRYSELAAVVVTVPAKIRSDGHQTHRRDHMLLGSCNLSCIPLADLLGLPQCGDLVFRSINQFIGDPGCLLEGRSLTPWNSLSTTAYGRKDQGIAVRDSIQHI